jgi:hypothetical protein
MRNSIVVAFPSERKTTIGLLLNDKIKDKRNDIIKKIPLHLVAF